MALIAPLLAGCGFQPMYAESTTGAQLDDVMRTVSVAPIPGRVGQRVRNELIFATTGGGYSDATQYRLEVAIRESVQDTFVARSGEAEGRAYRLTAAFKLIRLEDETVVVSGKSISRAAYDNLDSTFADIRARRDAENRAARTVADDIQTRVAMALSRDV
ncbi:LPS assembly lipoprotein LptE [Dichotomicrobium thermohalophilum]|nr:LPS assembly lipoprotein LptE [Dichotomicrobium thermohalophilum]